MADAIAYRRLRAPREHGESLIDPPLEESARLLEANLARHANAAEVTIGGSSLGDLASAARARLLDDAIAHTSRYAPVERPATSTTPVRLILSGHQPELFHPGVWFKNFVLSALARRLGAQAVNLVIDNDTIAAPLVRVPRNGTAARLETVPIDEGADELPFEERPIRDPALLESFPERLEAPGDALVGRLWARVRRLSKSNDRLGEVLAGARHALERELGLSTLEVPLSRVCDAPEFATFAWHLLVELPRLQEVYNASLAEYRRVNHVRSHAHPVPELTREGNRLEAPLWIWTSDAPQRRPLFVERRGDRLELSADGKVLVSLSATDAGAAAAEWQAARQRGIKIRPRALITTMYARLVLSDLFLHGIGGAKYDQLTDAIIQRLFGIEPPEFMTVTATLKLHPLDIEGTAARLREVEHHLREIPYHPETYACAASEAQHAELARLTEEKRRLVHAPPPKGARRGWHQAIVAINEQLRPLTRCTEERLRKEAEKLAETLRQERIFGSREFAFCLFDDALVRELFELTGDLV